jgi:hypothetical protein
VVEISRKICHYFEKFSWNSAAEKFADLIMRPLNIQGETCLEMAAKKGHWDILNKLIKQLKCYVYENWRLKREYLPLFYFPTNHVEFIRDISGKIPITEIIGNLISIKDDDFIWVEFIFDSVMSSPITREVKIVALELMGAVFIFWWSQYRHFLNVRHLFVNSFFKGIQCWKDALILRDATADGEPAIPNIPCVLPERLRHVFRMEEMTFEELEQIDILTHSNIDWFNNEQFAESIEIQALLISYKIFKRRQSNNEKTSLMYFYYQQLLDYAYRANTYRFRRDLNQVTNILVFHRDILR